MGFPFNHNVFIAHVYAKGLRGRKLKASFCENYPYMINKELRLPPFQIS